MEFVENLNDIIENIKTLEKYLTSSNNVEKEFAQSLVKKGRTILVYKVDGQNHFAPSRFLGYKNNTMDDHLENEEKDGRDTNPIIDQILGRVFANDKTESKFVDYCAKIGVVPDNVNRRYWRLKDKHGKNLTVEK
jgi:hypothetical protein